MQAGRAGYVQHKTNARLIGMLPCRQGAQDACSTRQRPGVEARCHASRARTTCAAPIEQVLLASPLRMSTACTCTAALGPPPTPATACGDGQTGVCCAPGLPACSRGRPCRALPHAQWQAPGELPRERVGLRMRMYAHRHAHACEQQPIDLIDSEGAR